MLGKESSWRKLINPHFAGVILFVVLNYYVYVYGFMFKDKTQFQLTGLVGFHILFVLLLWSMGAAILGDPGRVPIYWGFFAQQSDNNRRRYCLLCHSFKPERCHHCSTCQRCVLNMDHHCPWISNCVGYNNRKYFMLFLIYIIVTLVYCLCFEISMIVKQCIRITEREDGIQLFTYLRGFGLIVQLAFLIVISLFFKFHVDLVLSNSSTLDDLERKKSPNMGPNVFDIGKYQNFEQVFGSKFWLWPFPISSYNGNGVNWRKKQFTK